MRVLQCVGKGVGTPGLSSFDEVGSLQWAVGRGPWRHSSSPQFEADRALLERLADYDEESCQASTCIKAKRRTGSLEPRILLLSGPGAAAAALRSPKGGEPRKRKVTPSTFISPTGLPASLPSPRGGQQRQKTDPLQVSLRVRSGDRDSADAALLQLVAASSNPTVHLGTVPGARLRSSKAPIAVHDAAAALRLVLETFHSTRPSSTPCTNVHKHSRQLQRRK